MRYYPVTAVTPNPAFLTRPIWSVITMLGLFGCSSPSVTEQAKLLGTKRFSQQSWVAGIQEQRGEMVDSFLSQHDTQSLSANTVKRILGELAGYYRVLKSHHGWKKGIRLTLPHGLALWRCPVICSVASINRVLPIVPVH